MLRDLHVNTVKPSPLCGGGVDGGRGVDGRGVDGGELMDGGERRRRRKGLDGKKWIS